MGPWNQVALRCRDMQADCMGWGWGCEAMARSRTEWAVLIRDGSVALMAKASPVSPCHVTLEALLRMTSASHQQTTAPPF